MKENARAQIYALAQNVKIFPMSGDVSRVQKPSNSLQIHVDEEDKTTYPIQVSGMNFKSKTVFINESGQYDQ